jgi:hypothetical protein
MTSRAASNLHCACAPVVERVADAADANVVVPAEHVRMMEGVMMEGVMMEGVMMEGVMMEGVGVGVSCFHST